MKKIISVFLCVLMLMSSVSMLASALTYYAGDKATTAPTVDGEINDNEYSWTSGKINAKGSIKSSPIANKLYATVDVTDSLSSFQLYMGYDDKYVYVAYKEVGTSSTEVWIDLNPRAGFASSQGQIFTYVNYSGSLKVVSYECTSPTDRSDKAAEYVSDAAAKAQNAAGQSSVHVELKFSRTALEKYAGGSFNQIGLRAVVQRSGGANGELFYADEASTSTPYWFYEKYGHHIVNLNNNGENPVDVVGTVSVDGLIRDGEYAWESDIFDRNIGVGSKFFVVTPHTDTEALTAQYFVGYDEEYVYVGFKERCGYETKAWFDLSPFVGLDKGLGQLMINVNYVRDNNVPANTGSDIMSVVSIREYSSDGQYKEVDATKYVAAAQGSWFDDGMRNNNAIELKISMSALEEYAGADVKELGLRGVIQDYGGESIFCNKLSKKAPLDFHTDKSYVVFELNGKGEVEEKEFEIDPSHVHRYDVINAYSDTQHVGACSDCGNMTYGFHKWDSGEVKKEATETTEGRIVYTCTDCGAKDEDVIPVKKNDSYVDIPETEPQDTEPQETTPTETEPAESETDEVSKDAGCGASLGCVAAMIVIMLGACITFVSKKK